MSKAVNAIIVGLTVFILLTGSIWYVTVARGPTKVSAVEVEQGWESINETATVMWGQVTFQNPYDFSIDLTSFTYELWVNEKRWAHNNSTDEVRLAPRGEAILPARVVINTTDMDDWLDGHIANGERTAVWFTGNATFRVGGGELSVPFERRQTWETHLRRNLEELRNCPQTEPAPCISDASVKWVLEDASSTLQLVLTVRNNNLDEMTITNRSARLALGGITIGAADATDPIHVARQSGRFFEFQMVIDRSKVVDWWMHHVQACERSEAALDVVLDYAVSAQTFPPEPTLPTTTSITTSPTTTTTSTSPTTTSPSTTTTSPSTATTSTSTTTTSTTTTSPTPTTTSPTPTTSTTSPAPTPAPTANLSSNVTSGHAPLDVGFTVSDDSNAPQLNISWTLNFGDGNTTSGTTLPGSHNHVYASPGTYQAVLTLTTDAGQSTDSITISAQETTVSSSSGPAAEEGTGSSTSSSSEPTQSWFTGLYNAFAYPWQATVLQLGLLGPEVQTNGRPTTNGVERIAWDLELGEFRTGFACPVES